MSRMAAASFLTLIVTIASAGQEQIDLQTTAKKVEASVVSVVAYDKDGKVLQRGTGFFASDIGDVITRGRTLPTGIRRVDATTMDGKTYPITAIAVEHRDVDVVRLWARVYERVRPLDAAITVPRVGEQVFIISMPQPDKRQVVEGTVSGIEELDTGRVIQVNATLPAGSSGSPVLNSRGEVIGVALYLGPDRATFSANGVEKLKEWAKGYSFQPSTPIKRVVSVYPPNARAARITGTVYVQVIVDETGKVKAARAVSGPVELRDAAVEAAYQWKFAPAMKDGVVVKATGTMPFKFTP